MKKYLLIGTVLASALFFLPAATFYPVYNMGVQNAIIPVIRPSVGVTNSAMLVNRFFSSPFSTTNSYPFVIQLSTNQNFVIQDDVGNNIFGLRGDAYPDGTARHWEVNFGSKNQGVLDQIFDMGNGADVLWRINGDLKQAFYYQCTPNGIDFKYDNTNYFVDSSQNSLFNSYGEIHAVALFGKFIHGTSTVTPGAAAGSGGSLSATFDNNNSDVSVQIVLTTGHTGLGAGTLFTYTLENAASTFDLSITTVPIKPVFSAADANTAGVAAVVYCTATGTGFTFKTTTAITADTTYTWNFFICR